MLAESNVVHVEIDKTHGDSVMELPHGLNVVAIVRSGEVGSALNQSCTEMNGTKVEVPVGHLADVHPDVAIFADVDVLLLDVDPSKSEEIANTKTCWSMSIPNIEISLGASFILASFLTERHICSSKSVKFLKEKSLRKDWAACLVAIMAASIRKVPEPHMGSTSGTPSFQPDSFKRPAAKTSLMGAVPRLWRYPRLNSVAPEVSREMVHQSSRIKILILMSGSLLIDGLFPYRSRN